MWWASLSHMNTRAWVGSFLLIRFESTVHHNEDEQIYWQWEWKKNIGLRAHPIIRSSLIIQRDCRKLSTSAWVWKVCDLSSCVTRSQERWSCVYWSPCLAACFVPYHSRLASCALRKWTFSLSKRTFLWFRLPSTLVSCPWNLRVSLDVSYASCSLAVSPFRWARSITRASHSSGPRAPGNHFSEKRCCILAVCFPQ